jgi:hypothetical protein
MKKDDAIFNVLENISSTLRLLEDGYSEAWEGREEDFSNFKQLLKHKAKQALDLFWIGIMNHVEVEARYGGWRSTQKKFKLKVEF